MNQNGKQYNTPVVDLFTPVNRFASASKIYGRLHRWWLLLRRYWWLPVLCCLCIMGPIYAYTALTGPTYMSKGRMWLTGKIHLSGDQLYTEELINFLGTQSALLSSPAIKQRALARLEAETANDGNPTGGANQHQSKIISEVKAFLRNLMASGVAPGSNAPPSIPFGVTVEEGSKSSTIELMVTGRDPVATQKYLNCLMEEYLSFKREAVHEASSHATTSLNTEAAELKTKLENAQANLQAFQASNDVVFLHAQGSSAESYLATLNRQLAVVKTELNLLDSIKPDQWTQTDPIRAGAISGQVSSDESVARQALNTLADSQAALFRADQQMHLLMAKREELSRFLQPEHPKIIRLDQDIAAQKELVRVSRDEATKQFALRREALQLQRQNLEAATKDWNAKAVEASRKMAAYDQIRQSVQRIQTAYDRTLNLMQTIDVGKRVEQADVGILDAASIAKPTYRTLKYLAAAALLSFMLCFGLLYCIAMLKDGFFSHEEMADQLGEQVVGLIPAIPSKAGRKSLAAAGLERQQFEFQEAFRSLRGSLLFMRNGGKQPRTVAISSSLSAEGKSTVALYLAITLARSKSRVLLIDGDLRRPSLHRQFDVPSGPGLAALLNEEVSFEDVVYDSGVPNLALLPAGEAGQHPGDLVLSPKWSAFLDAARAEFDYILVDTPPLGATDDAVALASKTDGVLFVVRAESTSARVARNALNLMRLRQTHIIGLVFNHAKSSPCDHQRYRGYKGSYHWAPDMIGEPVAGKDRLLSKPVKS